MSAYTYIEEDDITNLVASGFELSGYLSRVNDHLDVVSYSLGVSPSGITSTHFIIKEYGRAWCLRELFRDKIGANNSEDVERDKYFLLYNIQNDEVEKLRKNLTPEVINNTADEPSELTFTATLIRG